MTPPPIAARPHRPRGASRFQCPIYNMAAQAGNSPRTPDAADGNPRDRKIMKSAHTTPLRNPDPIAMVRAAQWRDGRAVEGARLESVYTVMNRIEGSNPSPSATSAPPQAPMTRWSRPAQGGAAVFQRALWAQPESRCCAIVTARRSSLLATNLLVFVRCCPRYRPLVAPTGQSHEIRPHQHHPG